MRDVSRLCTMRVSHSFVLLLIAGFTDLLGELDFLHPVSGDAPRYIRVNPCVS